MNQSIGVPRSRANKDSGMVLFLDHVVDVIVHHSHFHIEAEEPVVGCCSGWWLVLLRLRLRLL